MKNNLESLVTKKSFRFMIILDFILFIRMNNQNNPYPDMSDQPLLNNQNRPPPQNQHINNPYPINQPQNQGYMPPQQGYQRTISSI